MQRRLIATLVVAALAVTAAFAAGRATRPDPAQAPEGTPAVALDPVAVDVPPLDRSGRVPALRRDPRPEKTTTATSGGGSAPASSGTAAPAATSAPAAVTTAAPQSNPAGQGDQLERVGGGVE